MSSRNSLLSLPRLLWQRSTAKQDKLAVNTVNSSDQPQSVRGQILLYDHWKELKWRSLYVVVALLVAGYNGLVFGEGIINLSWVLVNMHTVESAYTNLIVAISSETASVWSGTNWQHTVENTYSSSSGSILITGNEQPALNKVIEKLIYTEITEGLWSRLWVAGYVSIMVTLPQVVYNVYAFVKPGLKWLEGLRLKQILWAFIFLLVAGQIVSLGLVLPRASAYLLNYQSINTGGTYLQPMVDNAFSLTLSDSVSALTDAAQATSDSTRTLLDIKYLGKVQSWVDFTIGISKYVVLVFELPLILLLVGAVGLKLRAGTDISNSSTNSGGTYRYRDVRVPTVVNTYPPALSLERQQTADIKQPIKTLTAWCLTPLNRKLLLFSLTVVAAISSPPDVISLFLVLVPLIILVECTLLVSIYLELVSIKLKNTGGT